MNDNKYEGAESKAYDDGKRYILLEFCRYASQGYTVNEIQSKMLEKHKYLELKESAEQ